MVVPVSFVSEHIETLEEIDIEYRELAEENGVSNWRRVSALNTDKGFIDDMADMVVEALQVREILNCACLFCRCLGCDWALKPLSCSHLSHSQYHPIFITAPYSYHTNNDLSSFPWHVLPVPHTAGPLLVCVRGRQQQCQLRHGSAVRGTHGGAVLAQSRLWRPGGGWRGREPVLWVPGALRLR